jgi:pyroglutamyl-peptidase
MRTVLLTGFEPFTPYKSNPTEELARALDGYHAGDLIVRSAVLPVHHLNAASLMRELIDALRPHVVLHLGLAGGRARVALERVAVNVMDYAVPDNAGCRKTDEPCVADGPPAYFATLPLRSILARLTDAGIPAYISDTAGTYLCNQTLYTTLHRVHSLGAAHSPGAAPLVGFVHLPLSPAMVAAAGTDEPSMDVPLMRRAVELTLQTLAS